MTNNEFFVNLSHIMEDTAENSEQTVRLGNIRTLIDERLIPTVEKIDYENKYVVIDNLKVLCSDMSIYTYFPELINKKIFCFYELDEKSLKSLNNALTGQAGKMLIGKSVPVYVNDRDDISLLNIAQKRISVSEEECEGFLRFTEINNFDLAGIVHSAIVPSERFKDIGALLCIPENADKNQKFYLPILHSANVLVINSEKVSIKLLQSFINISSLIIFGKDNGNFEKIKSYCSTNDINVTTVSSFGKALSTVSLGDTADVTTGSSFTDKLEKELYEFMWYLAGCKNELKKSFVQMNDNLLYQDSSTADAVRVIKEKYSQRIEDTDKLYEEIRSVSDMICKEAAALQTSMGINDTEISDVNLIEELIIKKSAVFKVFTEADSKEKIRNYCNIYKKFEGCDAVADIFLKDFLDEKINRQDKITLLNLPDIKLKSDFTKHKIIELCVYVGFLDVQDACIDLAKSIKSPLTNVEMRVLGEYYGKIGVNELAKQYLMTALRNGDLEAGEIYRERYVGKVDLKKLAELANLGVGKAAMSLGKQLYTNVNSTQKLNECLKYLTIAASCGRAGAAKMLGDIYYEEELTQYMSNKNKDDLSSKALNYYLMAEKNGSTDKDNYERIAHLNFKKKNYDDCMKYCEKSQSGFAKYLQGEMYCNGFGVAVDKEKALKFYEEASSAGLADAQVKYERLVTLLNEEKKKTTVSANTDYSSYSYYSGYYSSYNSSW